MAWDVEERRLIGSCSKSCSAGPKLMEQGRGGRRDREKKSSGEKKPQADKTERTRDLSCFDGSQESGSQARRCRRRGRGKNIGLFSFFIVAFIFFLTTFFLFQL